jgi:3-hydroxy-9,10-secoandrosta-1,3,5(10)-triene-9,17-dione monooxygenase
MALADRTRRGDGPIPPPEPDLTPDEVVRRAASFRDELRQAQDEADQRGHHSAEMNRAFVAAGLYRILQPRRFGGYEFDHATFYRAMLEICRGHPSVGWCLTLGASHCALIAAHWPQEAQADFFGAAGEFRAPHRTGNTGSIRRGDGGYVVEGSWNYASGIPHATHFVGSAALTEGGRERSMAFVVARDRFEILDDWGGDATLGMRASGSNGVRMGETFVPEHHVIEMGPGLWSAGPTPEGTFGTRLHGNPMYLGRMMGPYHSSLVVPVIGAARAAIDEFDGIARARRTRWAPVTSWAEHGDHQRQVGLAIMMTDAAEAILFRACDLYKEYCRRWAEDGTEFTLQDSFRLWTMQIQAGHLAGDATEIMFRAASSAAARKGQPMERYYRDISMYRGHTSAQTLNLASGLGRLHFDLPMGMFGV